MNDLISRRAAMELLYKRLIESANNNVGYVTDAGIVFEDIATERIERWLNELPTIDSVPVVRCKDCKHRPIDGDYKCPCRCNDPWYS